MIQNRDVEVEREKKNRSTTREIFEMSAGSR